MISLIFLFQIFKSNRSAERCKKAGTRNDSEFDLKPLVLIGIVDSSKLNDFKSKYDGVSKEYITN
jgi:hypothetical protein